MQKRNYNNSVVVVKFHNNMFAKFLASLSDRFTIQSRPDPPLLIAGMNVRCHSRTDISIYIIISVIHYGFLVVTTGGGRGAGRGGRGLPLICNAMQFSRL